MRELSLQHGEEDLHSYSSYTTHQKEIATRKPSFATSNHLSDAHFRDALYLRPRRISTFGLRDREYAIRSAAVRTLFRLL